MKRIYEILLADHFAHNRQMAFLSGPRQVGKTTLAERTLPGSHRLSDHVVTHTLLPFIREIGVLDG